MLYDPENDFLMIRDEARIWFIHASLLIWFITNSLTLLLLYQSWCISLVTMEEDPDEMHENDMYKSFEVYFSLRPYIETEGLVLTGWDFEDIVESAIFDSGLDLLEDELQNEGFKEFILASRSIVSKSMFNLQKIINRDEYNEKLQSLLERKRKKIKTEEEFQEIEERANILYFSNTKFVQSKLTLSSEFYKFQREATFFDRWKIKAFKSKAIVQNRFLADSMVYRGIYGRSRLDFERLIYSSDMINKRIPEHSLASLTYKELNDVSDFKYNDNLDEDEAFELEQLVLNTFMPSDVEFYAWLEERTWACRQK